MGVETFSLKKLMGVLGTLTGVILTSTIDLSGETDKNRGLFPHKSKRQIAIGDTLAFGSAVMYAIYTTVLKKKVGSDFRVNMPLFFGFVGLFNIVALLPGLIIFHIAGLERFELPPTKRILFIVLVRTNPQKQGILLWSSPWRHADKRNNLPCLWHLLGLLNAPYLPPHSNSRAQYDDSRVPCRSNHYQPSKRQLSVLGRGHYCFGIFHFYQLWD